MWDRLKALWSVLFTNGWNLLKFDGAINKGRLILGISNPRVYKECYGRYLIVATVTYTDSTIILYIVNDADDEYARNRANEVLEYLTSD